MYKEKENSNYSANVVFRTMSALPSTLVKFLCAIIVNLSTAFIDGSSKQGNAFLAYVGSIWVVAKLKVKILITLNINIMIINIKVKCSLFNFSGLVSVRASIEAAQIVQNDALVD